MLHTQAEFVETKAMPEMTEQRIFTFRASTSAVDRQGEVIDQAGWMLDDYKRNPVILDSHRYGSIDDVLGRALRIETTPQGLEVDVEFAETERGQMARRMVEGGFLRTVSVGFRSLDRRPGGKGQPTTHSKMELLEVSMVAIPANREAVRIRGVEDEAMDTTEKAGRRMSKASAEKIRAAIAMLSELIEDHFSEMQSAGMHEEKPKPKSLNVNQDTLAALSRFTMEAHQNGQ
jgi:HK97 family phage prohead protease